MGVRRTFKAFFLLFPAFLDLQWRFYSFVLAVLAALSWYAAAVTGTPAVLVWAVLLTASAGLLPIMPTIWDMDMNFRRIVVRLDRRFDDGELSYEQAEVLRFNAAGLCQRRHALLWPYYWLSVAPKLKRQLES